MFRSAALLTLLLTAPGFGVCEAPPAWVQKDGLDPDHYPASRFLTGYGLSSPGGTDAAQRRQAVAAAEEALAGAIRTRVSSDFSSRVTQRDQQMSRFAQNLVRTRADVELDGLDTVLAWPDPRAHVTHALAVLDKPRTLALLAEKLDRQAQACAAHYDAARTAGAVPGLLQARHLREDLDEGLLVRTVLGGAGAEPAAPAQADIDRELRRILADRKDLESFVATAALDLGAHLPRGIRVLMDRITYGDTPFCGSLSAFLEQALAGELVTFGQVKMIDKAAGREAIREAGVDQDLAETLRSQAVVRGTCFGLGDEVQLNLRIAASTGEELAATTLRVPVALVRKAGLQLAPENLEEASQALEICAARVEASKLRVKLALDRGDGGIYRRGEKLHLFLKASMDCYVKLVYHQVDGTNVVIFPNRFHPDARIQKGVLYQVPPDDNSFDLEVDAPFGAELVKVVAATVPLELAVAAPDANGLRAVQEDLASLVGRTRGIALKQAQVQYCEDTVVVNTLEADQP
jgi:hypothetical protein